MNQVEEVMGRVQTQISRGSRQVVSQFIIVQAAEGNVLEEEITVPGEPPGVYGCDYRRLARIAVLHAGARLNLLQGDSAVSQLMHLPASRSMHLLCCHVIWHCNY